MIIENSCRTCVHFLAFRSCVAFEKIPDSIWEGSNKHTTTTGNDNGITYKKAQMVSNNKRLRKSGEFSV